MEMIGKEGHGDVALCIPHDFRTLLENQKVLVNLIELLDGTTTTLFV